MTGPERTLTPAEQAAIAARVARWRTERPALTAEQITAAARILARPATSAPRHAAA